MAIDDDPLDPPVESRYQHDTYTLSTAIYAERSDGHILLLKRAEGSAMSGLFFLPGGLVDVGEEPFGAAARELEEEAGLVPDGPLEMVGCYPMWMYGRDMLQLSFRARVSGDVELSHEHTEHQWVDPAEFAALFDESSIDALAKGDERIERLLHNIGADVRRYVSIVG